MTDNASGYSSPNVDPDQHLHSYFQVVNFRSVAHEYAAYHRWAHQK